MLLSELTGIKPTVRTFAPSHEFVDPTGIIGVEVEVEYGGRGYPYRRQVVSSELWKDTSDGSLRNNGREYVSIPLFGEDLYTAISYIDDKLSDTTATITDRCGLHIHMDVSGLSTNQLLSILIGFCLVENAIYKYKGVGLERRNNIYCLPLGDTGNILPYLNNIKYGQTNDDIIDGINATSKYSGLNILPITYQGSIEFRHHKGTFKKEEIIKWINILMGIKTRAIMESPQSLVNKGYQEIKNLLLPDWMDYSNSDYLAGYLTAKDILNFNRLEHTWDTIKDPYMSKDYLTTFKSKEI